MRSQELLKRFAEHDNQRAQSARAQLAGAARRLAFAEAIDDAELDALDEALRLASMKRSDLAEMVGHVGNAEQLRRRVKAAEGDDPIRQLDLAQQAIEAVEAEESKLQINDPIAVSDWKHRRGEAMTTVQAARAAVHNLSGAREALRRIEAERPELVAN